MIKAIVFDLGGVVFTPGAGSYDTRADLAQELKIDTKKMHDFWFLRKKDMLTGKMSEENYLTELITLFGLEVSLPELKKMIRSPNVIDEEMVEIIKDLRENYIVFALTNDVSEWIQHRIEKFNLEDVFEKIISSSDLGLAKPDPEIYLHLINELNINPEEIVFIDNRIENVEAAAGLGIKAFHFTDKEKFKEWLKNEVILD